MIISNLVEALGELLLVLGPDELEEVEMPVEGLVLVLPQLLQHRLDPQHQELKPRPQRECVRVNRERDKNMVLIY